MPTQTDAPVPQRWERPFPRTPGYWKQQLATKYLAIAGRGDLVALRQLLAEHPEWLNKRGPHNRTLLVDYGASLTLRDQQGQTALDLARAAGKTAIVELLRVRGTGVSEARLKL
jgi:hypothetical protein